MTHIIFILIKPFSDPSSCPMDGAILEETTPIRMEMFHHRIKVITQNNFVLICSDPSQWPFWGDKWTQTMPAKCPPEHNKVTRSPHCTSPLNSQMFMHCNTIMQYQYYQLHSIQCRGALLAWKFPKQCCQGIKINYNHTIHYLHIHSIFYACVCVCMCWWMVHV